MIKEPSCESGSPAQRPAAQTLPGRVSDWLQAHRMALITCFLLFALSRIVILTPAYLLFSSSDPPPAPAWYLPNHQGVLVSEPWNMLTLYDSTHYLKIAQEGYRDSHEVLWYPLYPGLIRAFGASPWSGIFVSNLLFFIGLLALYRIGGKLPVALACFAPISFLFSAVYGESLFFALIAWFLVALKENRIISAGILAGLAACSRAPGVVLPLFLGLLFFWRLGQAENQRWPAIKPWLASLGLAGVLGLAYPVFLWLAFGSPFEMAAHQTAYRNLMPFWWGTVTDVSRLFGNHPADAGVILLNLLGLVWIGISLLDRETRWLALLYALLILSFPVTRSSIPVALHGLIRYAMVWPAGYLWIARTATNRYAFSAILAVFVILSIMVGQILAVKSFVM